MTSHPHTNTRQSWPHIHKQTRDSHDLTSTHRHETVMTSHPHTDTRQSWPHIHTQTRDSHDLTSTHRHETVMTSHPHTDTRQSWPHIHTAPSAACSSLTVCALLTSSGTIQFDETKYCGVKYCDIKHILWSAFDDQGHSMFYLKKKRYNTSEKVWDSSSSLFKHWKLLKCKHTFFLLI